MHTRQEGGDLIALTADPQTWQFRTGSTGWSSGGSVPCQVLVWCLCPKIELYSEARDLKHDITKISSQFGHLCQYLNL